MRAVLRIDDDIVIHDNGNTGNQRIVGIFPNDTVTFDDGYILEVDRDTANLIAEGHVNPRLLRPV